MKRSPSVPACARCSLASGSAVSPALRFCWRSWRMAGSRRQRPPQPVTPIGSLLSPKRRWPTSFAASLPCRCCCAILRLAQRSLSARSPLGSSRSADAQRRRGERRGDCGAWPALLLAAVPAERRGQAGASSPGSLPAWCSPRSRFPPCFGSASPALPWVSWQAERSRRCVGSVISLSPLGVRPSAVEACGAVLCRASRDAHAKHTGAPAHPCREAPGHDDGGGLVAGATTACALGQAIAASGKRVRVRPLGEPSLPVRRRRIVGGALPGPDVTPPKSLGQRSAAAVSNRATDRNDSATARPTRAP